MHPITKPETVTGEWTLLQNLKQPQVTMNGHYYRNETEPEAVTGECTLLQNLKQSQVNAHYYRT